jgi:SOS-response transcriptional repressor LexA
MKQSQLAEAVGVPPQTITKTMREEHHKFITDIARVLEVPEEWLRVGENPPAWAIEAERLHTASVAYLAENPSVSLVGAVTAGDGLVSFEDDPRPMRWKPSWAIMLVEGVSAYPVVYPGQYVTVDTDRPVHHNNIVVIQVDNSEAHEKDPTQPRVRAYLKRYCKDPDAPHGYLLASINSGRDTPYIRHERILVMLPVVGVWFEDADKIPSDDETVEVL